MTLLIKNGLIYDGSGNQPVKGSVLVKDSKVAWVGEGRAASADKVIDAMNAVVAPGFIDINTDSDHYLSLFSEPSQKDFLLQGVTTIIGGNCGASLAPLLDGSLRSVRKWGDTSEVNVNWHSLNEFLNLAGRLKLGVNFGTLVGHSTIRRAIVGEDSRDLTEDEIRSFKNVLEQAFEDGAFGFSTGLGYSHAKNVPYSEIAELAEVVSKYKRVYATHLRDETRGLVASISETIKLAEETKANVEITHYRPLRGFEKDYEESLGLLERRSAQVHINFDLYPFDTSTVLIYTLLPDWAKKGGLEMMLQNISNPATYSRIKEEMPSDINPDDFVIAKVPSNLKFFSGKTLKVFAGNQNLDPKSAIIKLMELSGLKAVVFYRDINLEFVLKAFFSPQAIISSNGASLPEKTEALKHERYLKTFPVFLELVAERQLMSLEAGLKKITSLPAEKYKIKDRGFIREGSWGDIVVMRGGEISEVLVNGELAVEDGRLSGRRSGRILRYES